MLRATSDGRCVLLVHFGFRRLGGKVGIDFLLFDWRANMAVKDDGGKQHSIQRPILLWLAWTVPPPLREHDARR